MYFLIVGDHKDFKSIHFSLHVSFNTSKCMMQPSSKLMDFELSNNLL